MTTGTGSSGPEAPGPGASATVTLGGDAENTNSAMAAELRGGLSFGLSGFTYWSTMPAGSSSRSARSLSPLAGLGRAHFPHAGARPLHRESRGNMRGFVEDTADVELKYSLMPYNLRSGEYSRSMDFRCCGHSSSISKRPDAWLIEDEYMFGSDLLWRL